jgi:hypothetical protein
MRYLASLLLSLSICDAAVAAFLHVPLPSPPKSDDVGEIVFKRVDWRANDDEQVTMPREEFLRYFAEGTFSNSDPRSIYESAKFAKPLNEKSGWQFCDGAFATKSGRVFFFSRPRKGVLEIEDSQHRTGWLILGPPKK